MHQRGCEHQGLDASVNDPALLKMTKRAIAMLSRNVRVASGTFGGVRADVGVSVDVGAMNRARFDRRNGRFPRAILAVSHDGRPRHLKGQQQREENQKKSFHRGGF